MKTANTPCFYIRENFLVVITILMFFPVTFQALFGISFDVSASSMSINTTIVSWSAIIGVFIFDYLFFEIIGQRIRYFFKKTIGILVLAEIMASGAVFTAIGLMPQIMKTSAYVPFFYMCVYEAVIYCMVFIPIIILCLFVVSFVWLIIEDFIQHSR